MFKQGLRATSCALLVALSVSACDLLEGIPPLDVAGWFLQLRQGLIFGFPVLPLGASGRVKACQDPAGFPRPEGTPCTFFNAFDVRVSGVCASCDDPVARFLPGNISEACFAPQTICEARFIGVPDAMEIDPAQKMPPQDACKGQGADSNKDGVCTKCEMMGLPDTDNDMVCDPTDNCVMKPNMNQLDSNKNGVGDACECDARGGDLDGDLVCDDGSGDGRGWSPAARCTGGNIQNCDDNCPIAPNPRQEDLDGDMVGNPCDQCPGKNDMADINPKDGVPDCIEPCKELVSVGRGARFLFDGSGNTAHLDTQECQTGFFLRDTSRTIFTKADNSVHRHPARRLKGLPLNLPFLSTSIMDKAGIYVFDASRVGGVQPPFVLRHSTNNWQLDSEAERSAVDAQVGAQLFYDMLELMFDYRGIDDRGEAMLSVVGTPGPPNARTSVLELTIDQFNIPSLRGLTRVLFPAGVTYTVSDGVNFPFSAAIDVIGHEWGHAVSQLMPDRGPLFSDPKAGRDTEANAVNEAFSDWLGTFMEHFTFPPGFVPANRQPDYIMAGDALRNPTDSNVRRLTRNLANPREQRHPDHAADLRPFSPGCATDPLIDCSHANSGPLNKAFFLMSEGGTHRGITVQRMGINTAIRIAFRANTEIWRQDLTLRDAARGMVTAANQVENSTPAIVKSTRDAFCSVGLLPAIDCPAPVVGTFESSPGGGMTCTLLEGCSVTFNPFSGGGFGGLNTLP